MKQMKKWLSGLLCAVLLLGLLPSAALAEEVDCTRAKLAELIYANESLKGLIGTNTTDAGFSDLNGYTDDQKAAINALANAGVLNGTSATTFDPTGTVTRAQAAVVLWRAAGCKSNPTASNVTFSDVKPGDWYTPAIQALAAAGIIQGTERGAFKPNDKVTESVVSTLITKYQSTAFSGWKDGATRVEMVVEAYQNYSKNPVLQERANKSSIQIDYQDIADCTEEEQAAITFFTKLGVVQGYNETPPAFHPDAAASNLQIAMFLKKCAELNDVMLLAEDPMEAAINAAFQFLADQGVTNVETAKANPHAPGLTTDLTTWNTALVPEAPAFTPAGGTYTVAQSVTINCEEGAAIYYTTDGSTPTTSSAAYTAPISIDSTATIKAIAVKNNLFSEVSAAAYTISGGGNMDDGWSYIPPSSTTIETERNPDGSTTTTVTDKQTGTVTETTRYPDGSRTAVETREDGTVTTTEETASGVKVETVTDAAGDTTAEVTLPAWVDRTVVTIPVENTTPGTVAVLVHPDGREEIVRTSVATETGVTLTVETGSTIRIVDNSRDFADVAPTSWAADAVDFVSARELFGGVSATDFAPDVPMTRQMLMTVLARLDGVDTTADPYGLGMTWAVGKGVSDGSDPTGTITREQLAVMLYRCAGMPMTYGGLSGFSDGGAVSPWAADAMAWAVENGIMNGMDGLLNPKGEATRAQVAAMIQRFCETVK